MGRFNMWMANLMRGRYGMDQMNRTLSIVALILIAANLFLRMRIINWLAVVLLIYIYCRAFSRNINRRAAENQRYLQFAGSVRSKFGRGAGNPYGQTPRTKDNTHKDFALPRMWGKASRAQGCRQNQYQLSSLSYEIHKKSIILKNSANYSVAKRQETV